MKEWSFKLKRSPIKISEKLDFELKSIGGFVFNINHEINESVTFKIRKRILYAWYLAFQNWTVVKGELMNNNTENETDVKITFNQHFFIRLIIFTHIILVFGFLIALILGNYGNTSMYILVGALIVLGIVLWLTIQRKFEKDIQKYKLLMTEIFEIQ